MEVPFKEAISTEKKYFKNILGLHSGFCLLFSGLSEKTIHFQEMNREQVNHVKVGIVPKQTPKNDSDMLG